MSTKKLSDINLQKEAVFKKIELLESRLNMIKNKIKTIKFDKNLAVIEDSRIQIQNRLDEENQ